MFREHSLTENGWGGDLRGQAAESQAAQGDPELFTDDAEGRCAGDSLGMMIRADGAEKFLSKATAGTAGTGVVSSFLRRTSQISQLYIDFCVLFFTLTCKLPER